MASRLAYAILFALAAQVAGAERVHARVMVAAADAVAAGEYASLPGVAQSTLELTDGGPPLPFLASDPGATGEGLETSMRAVRVPRVGHERADAGPTEARRSTQGSTRARALALAYLDYSLALFHWRAGIPTNHTTAPPPHHS